MTEIVNGNIMTVLNFLNEARAGQITDAEIRKKPVRLDRDGKPKEGSAELKIINEKEVKNLTQAPIYELDCDVSDVNGKQYVKTRKIVLDCNNLSASISVFDLPKSQEEIAEIQEKEEKARLKQKERETGDKVKEKKEDKEPETQEE